MHPDLKDSSVQLIEDVLGVEVHKTTIRGEPLVGSYIQFTNKGGMVHPQCSIHELEALMTLTGVHLSAGTVNCGSAKVGADMVANDFSAFIGTQTTATEITVIDAIYQLNESRNKCAYAEEDRADEIYSLLM